MMDQQFKFDTKETLSKIKEAIDSGSDYIGDDDDMHQINNNLTSIYQLCEEMEDRL